PLMIHGMRYGNDLLAAFPRGQADIALLIVLLVAKVEAQTLVVEQPAARTRGRYGRGFRDAFAVMHDRSVKVEDRAHAPNPVAFLNSSLQVYTADNAH